MGPIACAPAARSDGAAPGAVDATGVMDGDGVVDGHEEAVDGPERVRVDRPF